ncbi:hypothetical protein CTAYLR_000691 [Chrysophaeum taylorii]|uniref:MYND-type domain-containing protein n=1 Tax=Chrysophaeum taylorii TaxID=2483200 RepID=A0AAD7XLF5_9STRA|nr:hypothetical protein CTAYLR_000691 [Chrysophaeum taylorii]
MRIETEEDDHVRFSFHEESLYGEEEEEEDADLVEVTEDSEKAEKAAAKARELKGTPVCSAACCSKDAGLRCSRCGVWYCSERCQRKHWREHRTVCKRREEAVGLHLKGNVFSTQKAPAAVVGEKKKKKKKGPTIFVEDDSDSEPPPVPEEVIEIEAMCVPRYAANEDP